MLTPTQRLPHECNEAGRCCFGSVVSLLPFDVWRLFISHNQPLAKYGVRTTVDLYDPDKNLVQMGLGPESGLPICLVTPRPFGGKPDGAMCCPFLEWDEDLPESGKAKLEMGDLPGTPFWNKSDGSARFSCALGNARPMQCELYPFGRVGEPGAGDEPGKWRFFTDLGRCKKCLPRTISDLGMPCTVMEHIQKPLISAYLKMTADYIQLMGMVQAEVHVMEARAMLAQAIYNFDSVLLNQGVALDDLPNVRPKKPEYLIQSGMFLVQTVFKNPGQPEEPQVVIPKESGLILPGDVNFIVPP